MNKIGVVFLPLFLMSIAIPANGQDTSRRTVATKDSAYHYPKGSFETDDFYPRQHQTKGFLENDFAFGGTGGTPGGLNLIAEKYIRQFGVRIEAGAFGLFPLSEIAGYQGDLCFVLSRSEIALLDCSVFYLRYYSSSIDDNNSNWTQIYGVGIAVDAKGFFFQIGFSPSYFKSLRPNFISLFPSIFQIGYVD
jgi:hypothetical protein